MVRKRTKIGKLICPLSANRVISHCKKNSDLSRRQTTMKSATDLPNGDLQHLREMTLRSA
jgi:hypothetical protein